ncbi:MAG TPA: imidazole glycerol phosphate synthase subunit HisH [Candidatus Gemmiger excrementipullorum]|uniref:Imidazole glycerol phosphate synthase subunit HisH n=1 Tax=Candidatus Gemmiger excrementipullorum TaxID=2838610 RepID=A0A9D2BUL5_9FIRM|nr:imidazole glycerol phosphate synthase subunit HisH [Candidatus Gemmiger excrementipullorum]
MRPLVTIVDYGRSNLLSVQRALEACGAGVQFAGTPAAVRDAGALVLPGVGAFADGMAQLRALGLVEPLCQAAQAGTPLLGICLGMQMLLRQSPEGGLTAGLGLIEGEVAPLPAHAADGRALKVPNVGWRALRLTEAAQNGPLRALAGATAPEVYFVHSYHALPARAQDCAAVIEFGGQEICAAVQRGNVTGLQFHPEKSGPAGLAILRAFVRQLG